MFSKIKRLGTTACQVQISLDLKELTILEKRKDISSIFVEFERKTKAISSLSLPWSDTNSPSVIAFDESLLLLTTLYRDSSGRFLEKNGNLLLKGYSTATSSTVKLGFVVLKLNSLAADYAPQRFTFQFLDGRGKPVGSIKTSVTAKYLRDLAAGDDESSMVSGASRSSIGQSMSERAFQGFSLKEPSHSNLRSYSEHHLNISGLSQSGILEQSSIREVCSIDEDDRDEGERDDCSPGLSCDFRSVSEQLQPSPYSEDLSKRGSENGWRSNNGEAGKLHEKSLLLQSQVDELNGLLYASDKNYRDATERAYTCTEAAKTSALVTENLRAALKEATDHNAILSKEKSESKIEMKKGREREAIAQESIRELKRAVEIAQSDSAAVQSAVMTIEIQKLQSRIAQMREQAAKALTEKSLLVTELELTKTMLVEADSAGKVAVAAYNGEVSEKKLIMGQLSASKKETARLENLIKDMEIRQREKEILNAEKAAQISVATALRFDAMLAKFNGDIASSGDALSKSQDSILRLSSANSQRQLLIEAEYSSKLDEKESSIQTVRASMQATEKKNKLLAQEVVELNMLIERKTNETLNEIERLTEEKDALEDSSTRKIKDMKSTIDALQLELKESCDELNSKIMECDRLRADLLAKCNQLKAVESENENLISQILEVNSVTEILKLEMQKVTQEFKRLSGDFQEANSQAIKLESNNDEKMKNIMKELDNIKVVKSSLESSLSVVEAALVDSIGEKVQKEINFNQLVESKRKIEMNLTKNCETLTADIFTLEESETGLKTDNKGLKRRIDKLVADLSTSLEASTSASLDAENKRIEWRDAKKILDANLVTISEQLESSSTDNVKKSAAIIELELAINKLKALSKSSTSENEKVIAKLKSDLINEISNCAIANSDLAAERGKVSSMSLSGEERLSEAADLHSKIHDLKVEIAGATATASATASKVEAAMKVEQEKTAEKVKKIEDLTTESENTRQENEKKIAVKEKKIIELTAESKKMKSENEKATNAYTVEKQSLQSAIETLNIAIENLKTATALSDTKATKDGTQLSTLTKALSEEKKLVATLKSTNKDLEEKVVSTSNEVEKVTKTVESKNSENIALQQQNKTITEASVLLKNQLISVENSKREEMTEAATVKKELMDELKNGLSRETVLQTEVDSCHIREEKLKERISSLLIEKEDTLEQLEKQKSEARVREGSHDESMKELVSKRKILETEAKASQKVVSEKINTSTAQNNILEIELRNYKLAVEAHNTNNDEDIAAYTVEIRNLTNEVERQKALCATFNAKQFATVDSYEKEIQKILDEQKVTVERTTDEITKENKALKEEIVTVSESYLWMQSDYLETKAECSLLEEKIEELESDAEEERIRYENQIILLLKAVGIYDTHLDPKDVHWVELFRLQLDEERIKIMTLKNCLVKFSEKLSAEDNSSLLGAGIILVQDVPGT